MRIPRRHRFRTHLFGNALFRALPAGERFRFAAGEAAQSVFGADPVAVLSSRSEDLSAGERNADPLLLQELRALLPRVPDVESGQHFSGGAIGFITYERGAMLEDLGPVQLERGGPDLHFAIYDTFATWHPASSEVEVVSWGLTREGFFDETLALRRAGKLEERLRAAAPDFDFGPRAADVAFDPAAMRTSLDRAAHARGVESILNSIARGDIYQANLTVRFDVPYSGDPVALFERHLAENPSPHAAYLEADGMTILSSSPERLLWVQGREVETRPIKGTSPRFADPVRDRASAQSLLASEKDQAELLMITDLLRNDLGKVCAYGSVRVPALRALESYAHVHHLVSTIRGTLRPPWDGLDALAAVFPCGSIAGAPKRRAMQILRQLEPAPRDVYTGTIGWVGFDRSSHWSVAIRTGILAQGMLSFGAGGGIVADSNPDAEWNELHWKAKAFTEALHAPSPEIAGRNAGGR
ncbi:MAG TPA: anthranilate synthase component I family protein [bacterium]|nr:anthranilate synthase component I family protein [bacterium]